MTQEARILIADEQSLCREGMAVLIDRTWDRAMITHAKSFSGVIGALSNDNSMTTMIVDLALPGLNGVSGASHLHKLFPSVRIVVTAAELCRDLVVDCLRAGVHGYICKASPAEEILEALETIRNGRIYVPAIISDEPRIVYRPERPKLLSERQREVLTVLAAGRSNKEIARDLGIAEGTVKVHVNAVFRALGVRNRVNAVTALRNMEQVSGGFEPALPGLLHPQRRAGDR